MNQLTTPATTPAPGARTAARLLLVLVSLVALTLGMLGAAAAEPAAEPAAGTPAGQAAAKAAGAKPRGYRPVPGGHFNDPYAAAAEQNRIENTILGAIQHAKRRSNIFITAFSLDRVHVARALVDAKRRGVRVRILLNDHQFTPAMQVLRDGGFTADRRRKSFMRQCRAGCRGGGYLHTKMYLFSHTGKARHVTMVGSANLTTNAVAHQWNDLYVANDDRDLYRTYRVVFRQMARDRQANPQLLRFKIRTKYRVIILPPNRQGPDWDPVVRILRQIKCKGAGTPSGRTQIRISQHRWSDRRGAWIAREVVNLWARGCDIRIMHGSADKYVRPELNRPTKYGLVPARSNGFDLDHDTFLDVYSHQKYMTIRGRYGKRKDAWMTMTGSVNWASLGAHGDENILLIRGKRTVKQWRQNFNFIWRTHSKPVVYRPRAGARTNALTVPEPRIGGEHWEGD